MPTVPATRRRRTPRQDPLLEQARAASTVRFGPERTALTSLARQAEQDLLTGAQIQKGVAEGIRAAARSVAPRLQQAYQQAAGSVQEGDQRLRSDLASISSAADPYRAAAGRETQAALARIAEAAAAAEKETGSREVQAEQGRAAGIRQLTSNYAQTRSRIAERQTALGREEGAFIQSTYGDLQAATLKAEQDAAEAAERARHNRTLEQVAVGNLELGAASLDETTRHNTATENAAANRPVPANQRFGMTVVQRREFPTLVNRAVGLIRNNPQMRAYASGLRDKRVWAAVRADLLEGSNPARKPFPAPVVNAAMDLAIYGYLSPRNRAYYQRHGIPGSGVRLPRGRTIYGNPVRGNTNVG